MGNNKIQNDEIVIEEKEDILHVEEIGEIIVVLIIIIIMNIIIIIIINRRREDLQHQQS